MKRSPLKRKKKSKVQKLKEELDRLIQEKYRQPGDKCLACGHPAQVLHHYIQKSQSMNLRWDDDNLVPLCNHCHCLHHQSGDPKVNQEILRKKGHEWADLLEERRRILFKATLSNLQLVEKNLKEVSYGKD